MAITDDIVLRMQAAAGQTDPINEVDSAILSDENALGTATLVDIGAEKAWQLSGDTWRLTLATPLTWDNVVVGSGVSMAVRFRIASLPPGTFDRLLSHATSAGDFNSGCSIGNNSGDCYFRVLDGSLLRPSAGTLDTGVVVTYVGRAEITGTSSDGASAWKETTGRVGTDPDGSMVGNIISAVTLPDCFIPYTGQIEILDWIAWNRELTDAEAAAVADDLRTQLPLSGGGAPNVSSAAINTAGTQLTITHSEAVSIGAGGNGGFTLNASGGSATLTFASGAGTTDLVYNISRTIGQSETATLDYTQPGDGVEATDDGTDLASFSGQAVTNNSTQDLTPPTLSSSVIPGAGTTIDLTFDEAVSVGAGGSGGVALSMSGGAVTATFASGGGTDTLTYNLSRTITSAETGTLDYTQPGDGLEDGAGNDLASITGAAVTNNSTQVGAGELAFTDLKDQDGQAVPGSTTINYQWWPDSAGTGTQDLDNLNATVEAGSQATSGAGALTLSGLTSGGGLLALQWTRAGDSKIHRHVGRYTAS